GATHRRPQHARIPCPQLECLRAGALPPGRRPRGRALRTRRRRAQERRRGPRGHRPRHRRRRRHRPRASRRRARVGAARAVARSRLHGTHPRRCRLPRRRRGQLNETPLAMTPLAPTLAPAPTGDAAASTLGDVLRSERTKFRTVASSWWTLLTVLVGTVAIGLITCWAVVAHWDQMSLAEKATLDPTFKSLIGLFIGQVAVGILGVLAITS